MNIGLKIKQLRIKNEMTQEDLAEFLGVSSKAVSRWENSITYPDITLLPILATIFKVTVDELLDVEKIKEEDYVKELDEQAFEYQKNNLIDNEVKMWSDAYKKLPHNEDIKIRYIDAMDTYDIIHNSNKYKEEIIKLSEALILKTNNVNIKDYIVQVLVNLYSMEDNADMADKYARLMPRSITTNYNVLRTKYLKDEKLLFSIQENIEDFKAEILRELEFVLNDNRVKTTTLYKKNLLDKVIDMINVLSVSEDDYGYDATFLIFSYIKLAELNIELGNNDVDDIINNIIKPLKYIKNFKPHKQKSVFVNQIECKHLGAYSNVLLDLKQNILNELNKKCFDAFRIKEDFNNILEIVNTL